MKTTTITATETANLYELAREVGASVELKDSGEVFLVGPGLLPGRKIGSNVTEAVEELRSRKSGAAKKQLHGTRRA